MSFAFLLLLMGAQTSQPTRDTQADQLIARIAASGRVLEIGELPQKTKDPKKEIAPGAPPFLSFRYFQGADRHRFGKLDLMLDDAGH